MTSERASKLDAHIRKGEKGSLVVYADSITRKETDEKTGDEIDREIPFLKGYTVFNVEQIDGLPFPVWTCWPTYVSTSGSRTCQKIICSRSNTVRCSEQPLR